MNLSILIVGYNNNVIIEDCLNSFYDDLNSSNITFEVVIVENGETITELPKYAINRSNVTWIKSIDNLGFARANNLAYEKSTGEVIIVMNPDILMKGEFIVQLYEEIKLRQKTICSCRLEYPNGEPQVNYYPKSIHLIDAINRNVLFEKFKIKFNSVVSQDIIGFSGALFGVKRMDVKDHQLFQPFFFMYDEEVDFFYRWNKEGGSVYLMNDVYAVHATEATVLNQSWKFKQKKLSHLQFIRNFYGITYYIPFFCVIITNTLLNFLFYPLLSFESKKRFKDNIDFSNWKYYIKLIFYPKHIYALKQDKD